jgi:hypothetical protein
MQLGVIGTVKTVAKDEGMAAFWKGIPAAWLRESSYTSLRLGLYTPLKKLIGADAKVRDLKGLIGGGCQGERISRTTENRKRDVDTHTNTTEVSATLLHAMCDTLTWCFDTHDFSLSLSFITLSLSLFVLI